MADLLDRLKNALADRYAIERELGRGGMATVYLAHDPKHDRKVALKVLHPELAAILGADRFLQEIKVTANLQHPHILPLFDSGHADGLVFYVMPYVEGESLRRKLNRETQLPVQEALRIATDVAGALGYAHRHGVIHRDIKPENILMHDGTALVADFGIALAVRNAGGQRLTETGLSLGTPEYMSPEQAAGAGEIDGRTDVYALGCVLYEMLAGDPPHTGPTAQAIIAKIITEKAPHVGRARDSVPEHVDKALATALAKLPADRFRNPEEFAQALNDPAVLVRRRSFQELFQVPVSRAGFAVWLIAAVLGAISVGAAYRVINTRRGAASAAVVRLTVTLPEGVRPYTGSGRPEVSADRQYVAYTGRSQDTNRIYIRPLNQFESRAVPGSENADYAFFSPDGEWIAFWVDQTLFKTALSGGHPVRLGTAQRTRRTVSRGGSAWGPDGRIYFVGAEGGLWAFPENGGVPIEVIPADSSKGEQYFNPERLTDRRIIFSISAPEAPYRFAALDLITHKTQPLSLANRVGRSGRYVEPGYLVFNSPGQGRGTKSQILAIPFDSRTLRPTGAPTEALEDASAWHVSTRGDAAYFRAPAGRIVWMDRAGRVVEPVTDWRGAFRWPRLSPDGTRLAIQTLDDLALWVLDLKSGTRIPMGTAGASIGNGGEPTWTPDSKRLTYHVTGFKGRPDSEIWWQAADGSNEPSLFFSSPADDWSRSFSPEGRVVAIGQGTPRDSTEPGDVVLVDRAGKELGRIGGRGRQREPVFSPDGRWIAYQSDESGRFEIYVRPYPSLREKYVVSSEGGRNPLWAANGRELFFVNGDRMMAADIRTAGGFEAGRPHELFRGTFDRDIGGDLFYDVARDGRFLMIQTESPELRVVLNWASELGSARK